MAVPLIKPRPPQQHQGVHRGTRVPPKRKKANLKFLLNWALMQSSNVKAQSTKFLRNWTFVHSSSYCSKIKDFHLLPSSANPAAAIYDWINAEDKKAQEDRSGDRFSVPLSCQTLCWSALTWIGAGLSRKAGNRPLEHQIHFAFVPLVCICICQKSSTSTKQQTSKTAKTRNQGSLTNGLLSQRPL